MDKELNLLDKLTNPKLNNEYFNKNDFTNINWDKFFLYSLKSKTVCKIFDSLQAIEYLNIIPSKIYKLMSEIFIGNTEHNKVLFQEANKITTELSLLKVNICEYKNLNTIKTGFEDFLMPNDIDYIAFSIDKNIINQYFYENGYKIKRINNIPVTNNFSNEINSILYEKNKTEKYKYPIKIDINYSFKRFQQMDCLMDEYYNSNIIEKKESILFIISLIDFFEHINGNTNNIKIEDFLKIKRLSIQYNYLNNITTSNINGLIEKYNLTNIFEATKDVLMNYSSFLLNT